MNNNESNNNRSNSIRIPTSCVSFASARIMSTRTLEEDPSISHPASTEFDRKALLCLTAFCTFFFAGASFGWGPMQLMLEKQGVYRSLCHVNDGKTCPEQAARLLNMNLTAQLIAFLSSPLFGEIADRKGPSYLMNMLAACAIIGNMFLAIAVVFGVDELTFPAFILTNLNAVSAGGSMAVKTGLVFDGKSRIRIIAGLNALFPAGGVTYLGLWALQTKAGISLSAILLSYSLVALLSFGLLCHYWRRVSLPHHDAINLFEESLSTIPGPPLATLHFAIADDEASIKMEKTCAILAEAEKEEISIMAMGVKAMENDSSTEKNNCISSRTPKAQLTSGLYLLLMTWFSFYTAKNMFTMTTARDFLSRLGDDETNNLYLSIFTIMMPSSVLALPLVDLVVTKYGFQGGLHVVNFAAVVHGLTQLLFTDLRLQVIGFVAFSIFRSFLYGVSFSLLASFLSPNVTGKGAGLFSFAVGLCLIVNIPLSNEALRNSFFIPNLIYTVLVGPCILAVCILGVWIQKDKLAALRSIS